MSRTATALVVAIVLGFCALADILFPYMRLAPMIRRQTPKEWMQRLHPRAVGLLWGLDTGTMVSTFRVSAASWAALILFAVGWAPVWMASVYGITFAGSLWLLITAYDGRSERESGHGSVFRMNTVDLLGHMLRLSRRIRFVTGTVLAAGAIVGVLQAGL